LDDNGNVIKKPKAKRTPKPVEEATIYYRLVKRDEKTDLDNAGYPSPDGSEKGEEDGEDPNEEMKGEDGGDNKEKKEADGDG